MSYFSGTRTLDTNVYLILFLPGKKCHSTNKTFTKKVCLNLKLIDWLTVFQTGVMWWETVA